MSVSRFPNPRTTNFIPEAWDFTILNRFANFILTYPIAQNASIVFQKVSVGTATLLTQMADTAYVIANLVSYLNSLPPLITSTTWLALQNFTTIETDTVNPIGTTITIGSGVDNDIRIASQNSRSVVLHLGDGDNATSSAGIHINNGLNCLGNVEILHGTGSTGTVFLGSATSKTSLGCPLTPMYSYPIIPVGAIGYRPPITFTTNGPISGTMIMRTCQVTKGTWVLYFFVNMSGIFCNNFTVEFGGPLGRRGTTSPGASLGGNPILTTAGAMTYFAATTTVTFRIRNDSGGTLNAALNPTSNCIAYRIA